LNRLVCILLLGASVLLAPRWAYALSTAADVSSKVAHSSTSEDEEDEDDGATIGLELDAVSLFVWRGIALNHSPALEPSGWASICGFNFLLWTNLSVVPPADKTTPRVSAIVPSVSYPFEWKMLKVEPGVLYYDLRGSGPAQQTAEASLESTLTVGAIHAFTDHYFDIAGNPGAYYGNIGAEYERTVGKWTFTAAADVGWATAAFNRAYLGVSVDSLNVAEVSASTRYDLTKVVYVALHAGASTLLRSALLRAGAEQTLGVVGVTVGVEH
jgi:hypothetical protein